MKQNSVKAPSDDLREEYDLSLLKGECEASTIGGWNRIWRCCFLIASP